MLTAQPSVTLPFDWLYSVSILWLSQAIKPEKTMTERIEIIKSMPDEPTNRFTTLAMIIPIRAANMALPIPDKLRLVVLPKIESAKNMPAVMAKAIAMLLKSK